MQQAWGGAGTRTFTPSSCSGLTAVVWGPQASHPWALLGLQRALPGW